MNTNKLIALNNLFDVIKSSVKYIEYSSEASEISGVTWVGINIL